MAPYPNTALCVNPVSTAATNPNGDKMQNSFSEKYFGLLISGCSVLDNKIGYIKSLSQEHGIVELEKKVNLKIGDKLSVIPVHSCLTVDKMQEFYVDENKFKIMT